MSERSCRVSNPEIEQQLVRLLASPSFSRAAGQSRLLDHLVRQALAGETGDLKELLIGPAACGRRADFDPRYDNVVRVESRRLRARLASYYEGEGRSDPVVIDLPKGGYVPVFSARPETSGAAAPRKRIRWRSLALSAAVAGVVAVAAWVAWKRQAEPRLLVESFETAASAEGAHDLGEALRDEVGTMASRIPGLRVLDVSAKPGRTPSLARYVLRGSVRAENGRLRVLARLVDTERGYMLWSDGYGGNLEDASVIAARVTAGVAQALGRTSPPAQPRHSNQAEAVRLYWQARALRRDMAPESLPRSAELLRRALAIDPGYALARVHLADALATMGFHQYEGAPELIRQARREALAALAADPGLFDAHGTLAWIQFYGDWDWRGSEASFRKALALNPSSGKTHATLALLLAAEGRFREALREARSSVAVDPLNQARSSTLAVVEYLARDCLSVRATARQLLEADPYDRPAHTLLAGCSSIEGRPADAVREMEAALKGPERFTYLTGRLGYAYARAGRIEEARRMLAETEPTQVHAAFVCAGLGDREGALRRLEESERRRETDVLFAGVEPLLDSLRNEPRFERLVRRVRGL